MFRLCRTTPERYADSPLNEAFAVGMDELILKHQPYAWIYRHNHFNVPEFRIGKARILTNQLGYVQLGENAGFRRDATIDTGD